MNEVKNLGQYLFNCFEPFYNCWKGIGVPIYNFSGNELVSMDISLMNSNGTTEYIGLEDNGGCFFYIRNDGEQDFTTSESENPKCSCAPNEMACNYRLVSVHDVCHNQTTLLHNFLYCLKQANKINGINRVEVTGGVKDFCKVWAEETLRPVQEFRHSNARYFALDLSVITCIPNQFTILTCQK